jgi:hypothetical protein
MTTKKYLRTAFMEGVAASAMSGSCGGAAGSAGSWLAAWYQSMPAMPAMRSTMLTKVQIEAEAGSTLPTMGSCGQLLV